MGDNIIKLIQREEPDIINGTNIEELIGQISTHTEKKIYSKLSSINDLILTISKTILE